MRTAYGRTVCSPPHRPWPRGTSSSPYALGRMARLLSIAPLATWHALLTPHPLRWHVAGADGGYTYEVAGCRLARPTVHTARACLRGRHVLFSGDSISRYLYLTLATFLVCSRGTRIPAPVHLPRLSKIGFRVSRGSRCMGCGPTTYASNPSHSPWSRGPPTPALHHVDPLTGRAFARPSFAIGTAPRRPAISVSSPQILLLRPPRLWSASMVSGVPAWSLECQHGL